MPCFHFTPPLNQSFASIFYCCDLETSAAQTEQYATMLSTVSSSLSGKTVKSIPQLGHDVFRFLFFSSFFWMISGILHSFADFFEIIFSRQLISRHFVPDIPILEGQTGKKHLFSISSIHVLPIPFAVGDDGVLNPSPAYVYDAASLKNPTIGELQWRLLSWMHWNRQIVSWSKS